MSAMSDYLEEVFLGALLNAQSFPTLSSVWLGLALSSLFTDANYASEVSGGGYARVQLTAGFTVADAGGGQWQAVNTNAFGHPAATANWGSPPTDKLVGCGLFDAATAGNLLVHGALSVQIPVYAGNVVYWQAGALVIEAQ